MPTSTLIDEVLSTTPSFRSERSVDEWTALGVRLMNATNVFGRIEGRGLKNADNECVEDEWYYIPENDGDVVRRDMLASFQRGGGKRRATVEKKQYYWKPVR